MVLNKGWNSDEKNERFIELSEFVWARNYLELNLIFCESFYFSLIPCAP